jgi:hypothetical protein
MKTEQSVFHGVVAGVVVVLMLLAGPAVAATSGQQDFRFRVLLDDDEIGTHHFRINREAGEETVEIDAEFKVKFIGITVYSYVHNNRELWRNGCLQRIESRTDDNGDLFAVDGSNEGNNRFQLATQDGERELAADCVMSFAYWNRDYLGQARLLNAQNGEFLEVDVESGGIERLRLDAREVPAERYRLRNRERDVDITVWYEQQSGEWLFLESRVDGRVIRYLPEGVESIARLDQPAATIVSAQTGTSP